MKQQQQKCVHFQHKWRWEQPTNSFVFTKNGECTSKCATDSFFVLARPVRFRWDEKFKNIVQKLCSAARFRCAFIAKNQCTRNAWICSWILRCSLIKWGVFFSPSLSQWTLKRNTHTDKTSFERLVERKTRAGAQSFQMDLKCVCVCVLRFENFYWFQVSNGHFQRDL